MGYFQECLEGIFVTHQLLTHCGADLGCNVFGSFYAGFLDGGVSSLTIKGSTSMCCSHYETSPPLSCQSDPSVNTAASHFVSVPSEFSHMFLQLFGGVEIKIDSQWLGCDRERLTTSKSNSTLIAGCKSNFLQMMLGA